VNISDSFESFRKKQYYMVLNTTKNSPVIVLRVLEKKQSPDLAIRVKPGGMLSDSTLSKSKDVRWEFPIILWSFIHGFSMEIKEGNSTELTKEP
jgi:hypothetical protein